MPLNNDYLQQIASSLGQGGTSGARVLNNEYLRRIAEGIGGIVDPSSGKVDASKIEGVIPAANLPSYVDDVIEGYLYEGTFYTDTNHEYEIEPESGKIYVDVSDDTSYRWTGTAYVSMGAPYELPTMSASTKGGAKLGDGLAITDGALGIDPDPQESTGEVRGAIASLTAKGWATQDGTPTTSNPVPIQVAQGRNLLDLSGMVAEPRNCTATVNDDGTVTIVKTSNAECWIGNTITTVGDPSDETLGHAVAVAEGSTLTLSLQGTANRTLVTWLDSDKRALSYESVNGTYTATGTFSLTVPSGARYVGVRVGCNLNAPQAAYVVKVQLELGSTATPYVPYGHVGVEVRQGSTLISAIPVPLPAKGYAASLPDGTADVLTINGAGKVEWLNTTEMIDVDDSLTFSWAQTYPAPYIRFALNTQLPMIRKMVNSTDPGTVRVMSDRFIFGGAYATNKGQAGMVTVGHTNVGCDVVFYPGDASVTDVASWLTWLSTHPTSIIYPLATPITEQCGYIDWPSIPDGAVITCPELDALGVRYLIGNGVAEMARDWYERGHAEAQGTSTALGELAQSVLDVDGKADAVAAQLVAEDVSSAFTFVQGSSFAITSGTGRKKVYKALGFVWFNLEFSVAAGTTLSSMVVVAEVDTTMLPAADSNTKKVALQTNVPKMQAEIAFGNNATYVYLVPQESSVTMAGGDTVYSISGSYYVG